MERSDLTISNFSPFNKNVKSVDSLGNARLSKIGLGLEVSTQRVVRGIEQKQGEDKAPFAFYRVPAFQGQ